MRDGDIASGAQHRRMRATPGCDLHRSCCPLRRALAALLQAILACRILLRSRMRHVWGGR